MKYIGFIKEFTNIPEAIPFQVIMDSSQYNDPLLLVKIIEYLDKGKLVFGWMGYVHDLVDNKPICPDAFYTDGTRIWPMHFPHYLRKYPNYPIAVDFIKHLISINFEFNIDPAIDMDAMEEDLAKKFQENAKPDIYR